MVKISSVFVYNNLIYNIAHLCSDCGKGFAYITNLRDHLKIHANIKEFQCPQCPQQCRTKRAMLLHMDVHNDNKYECQVCHKIFR